MVILLLFFSLIGAEVPSQTPTASQAVVLGIVEFGNGETKDVLTAPDGARVGEDFNVTITTFGGGCERAGETSVVITATGAELMVYDFTTATRPDIMCTAIIKRLRHTVTLRFEKPGDALIRVWGRRVGADTAPMGVPIVLEHRITVR